MMTEEKIVLHPEALKPMLVDNTVFRSAYDFELTKLDYEKAYSELGETEELRRSCLKKLKEKLLGDKDVQYRLDDSYLLRYLRFRKFDCERAYNTIRNFYRLRSKQPGMYCVPSNLETLMDYNVTTCLPYRDETGSIIFWHDTRKWNAEELSLNDLLHFSNIISDILSMNPSSQVNSITAFFDLGGLNPRHWARCLHPNGLLSFFRSFQECHPWRVKRIIFFNSNAVVRATYHLVGPRFARKLFGRIVILGSNVGELHQYINPAILPKCYGGNMDESQWRLKQLILDNLKYLEYEHSFIKT